MQPTENQFKAAEEMTNAVLNHFTIDGGIHSETAISACARLAGTFYFRHFNFTHVKAEPGSVVLSEEANEHGPELIQYLGGGLGMLKVELQNENLNSKIPDGNQPHMQITQMQTELESKLSNISKKFGLSNPESAQACALATAQLISLTKEVLDPHIGFAIASMGFVEGTKTMPPIRAIEKPWYKFW